MNKKQQQNTGKLKIIPLGGLEQIGMNITAFEYGESIIVVDCGLAFPEDDMLGIDLVIPDISYLKEERGQGQRFLYHPWSRGSYRCYSLCYEGTQCADLRNQTDQWSD